MKKIFFLIAVCSALCINLHAQKKLGYVTDPTAALYSNEAPIIDALKAAGYEVTIIPTKSALPDVSGYDVLVLSAVPNSGDVALSTLKDASFTKPFVNMKTFQLQFSRWGWLPASPAPANNSVYKISVPAAMKNHPLYNGIQFTGANENELLLSTATSGNGVVTVTFAGGALETCASVLANLGTDPTKPSYFEIPIGSTLSGKVTTHKHVVLGLSESSWGGLTSDAVKIAVNAVNYVLTPGNFVRQWNWERWSAATIANLTSDTALASTARKWYSHEFNADNSIKRFKNWGPSVATLVANGVEIEETKDILLPSGLSGGSASALTTGDCGLRVKWGDDGIQLGSTNKVVTIKNLKAGQFVRITLKSGNATDARGISAISNNMTGTVGTTTYKTGDAGNNVYNFEVITAGDVTFTYNAGVIIKSILVTQNPAPTINVAIPVVAIAFNPATKVKTVSLTCETAESEIYYTTDGTTPAKTSTRYTAPFEMTAENFQIRSRAWVGESPSPGFGEKSWNDPVSFNPNTEYYIFSHGADEAGLGQSRMTKGLYLYAASASDVRWKDSTTVDFSSATYKWKLEDANDGFFKFKNVSSNTYAAKGSIAYATSVSDPTERTAASLVLNATGDAFYILKKAIINTTNSNDNARPWTTVHYAIQFGSGSDELRAWEVNNGSNEGTAAEAYIAEYGSNPLANSIQINNNYADRARFLWIITTIPGGLTSINTPNINKEISKILYFDVMGRQVTEFSRATVIIQKTTYIDGSVEAQKLLILK